VNAIRPCVLDTSAILAFVNREPGASTVVAVLPDAVISSVTLAEAYSVFSRKGQDGVVALGDIRFSLTEVVPFTERQAEITGYLRATTSQAGLSLGDRACLSLAIDLGCAVYTADRVWATLNLPCNVHLIR
jgi:ribonuclease VapC